MTIGTFVAASPALTAQAAVSLTIPLPVGLVLNDILLLCLATANQGLVLSDANGGSWTEVTGSPQGTGDAGALDATRLTVFWSRYNGTQGDPSVFGPGAAIWDTPGSVWDSGGGAWDGGDVTAGVILAFRRCKSSGTPWDTATGGTVETESTALSVSGGTTTGKDRLVVVLVADSIDSNLERITAGYAMSGLVNARKVWDAGTTIASNVGLVAFIGDKVTAGTYGTITAIYTLATRQAYLTVILAPAVETPPKSPLEPRFAGTPWSLASRVARATW
jgi:hypothetical protein